MQINDLENAVQNVGSGTLTEDQIAFSNEAMEDAAAIQLVLGDVAQAEAYRSSRGVLADWQTADNRFAAIVPAENWDNGQPRSNLGVPVCMEIANELLPQIDAAFFGDAQVFIASGKAGFSESAIKSVHSIITDELEHSNFRREFLSLAYSTVFYGFGVGKTSGKTEKQTKYIRSLKNPPMPAQVGLETIQVPSENPDELIETPVTYEEFEPSFTALNIRNVLFAADLRTSNIRKSKWVVEQLFPTIEDIRKLRNNPNYKNIPSDEHLKQLATPSKEPAPEEFGQQQVNVRTLQSERQNQPATVNPLQQPFEILEYWNHSRVIAVLNRKLVIRNQETDEFPYFSCGLIEVPEGSGYTYGVAKIAGPEQSIQQGVINAMLDSEALNLMGVFEQDAISGVSNGGQSMPLRPGKVLPKGIKKIQFGSSLMEAEAIIAASATRARKRCGSNQMLSGSGPDQPGQVRNAAAVNAMSSGLDAKLQYLVEKLSEQVFTPVIYAFHAMNLDNMKPSQMRRMLGTLAPADLMEIYNGEYKFKVLASSRLQRRKAAMTAIPAIVPILQSAPVMDSFAQQSKKFNWLNFINLLFDSVDSDLGSELVQDMTDEEKQAYQQIQNQQSQAAQLQEAKIQQTFAGASQLQNEKQWGQMATAAFKTQLKHAEPGAANKDAPQS